MMTERVDCIIVGAGVVGLAVARALALAGREAVVLERADAIGTETSSRNSEVVHAGIYYPSGSLKALLCVAGKPALYRYCAERGIEAPACGKLILARDERQLDALAALRRRAEANGVTDLVWLDRAAVRRREPAVRCAGALLSPSTGIIDSHAFMVSLRGEAEAAGALFAFLSPFLGGKAGEAGIAVEVGGREPMRLRARAVVNSAGLWAGEVARSIEGLPAESVPRHHFAKGSYFTLSGPSPFRRLIYPLPEAAGLGVHVTLDLAGRARFGPDVEWVEDLDYQVDRRRAEAFYGAVRRYWPELPDGALQPDYAGIRPKLQGPGEAPRDFVIQGPAEHGVPGLVNLYGIESPGLTAALAIADRVAALLARR